MCVTTQQEPVRFPQDTHTHTFHIYTERLVYLKNDLKNEENSDPGVWILDFNTRLAFRQLYDGHGLLENHLCRRKRRQLDDHGIVVLVKPVERLYDRHFIRH